MIPWALSLFLYPSPDERISSEFIKQISSFLAFIIYSQRVTKYEGWKDLYFLTFNVMVSSNDSGVQVHESNGGPPIHGLEKIV